jgi:hypothetical protein
MGVPCQANKTNHFCITNKINEYHFDKSCIFIFSSSPPRDKCCRVDSTYHVENTCSSFGGSGSKNRTKAQ